MISMPLNHPTYEKLLSLLPLLEGDAPERGRKLIIRLLGLDDDLTVNVARKELLARVKQDVHLYQQIVQAGEINSWLDSHHSGSETISPKALFNLWYGKNCELIERYDPAVLLIIVLIHLENRAIDQGELTITGGDEYGVTLTYRYVKRKSAFIDHVSGTKDGVVEATFYDEPAVRRLSMGECISRKFV